jgi:hypothetical protein
VIQRCAVKLLASSCHACQPQSGSSSAAAFSQPARWCCSTHCACCALTSISRLSSIQVGSQSTSGNACAICHRTPDQSERRPPAPPPAPAFYLPVFHKSRESICRIPFFSFRRRRRMRQECSAFTKINFVQQCVLY